ncbi:MAG: zinc ribbon domain-containing protein [Woeseia sp.]
MPIYEYACQKCAHTFDALQKMSDEPLLDCPECGQPELKKLISAPNFRLKGGGWYETDFKTDKQRNVHKSENDSSASSSTKSAAESGTTSAPTTDSKPAVAKADSKSSSASSSD